MEEPEFLHGILIYNLPPTKTQAAITYLLGKIEQPAAITSFIDDVSGLKVFFNDYTPACLLVIERHIVIENSTYAVFPTVTNLTVHRIRPMFPNADAFRDHVQNWGPIINVYPVKSTIDESKTFETDDLRVIFNIPEVPELLKDIPSFVTIGSGHSSFDFEVSHFCRLCRREGHIQFHCTYSPGRFPINTEVYQEPTRSGAETPGVHQRASEVNAVSRDETVYGCFSPIKTPSAYHLNHYQDQSFEQIPSSSFDTPDACNLNKIKSEPGLPSIVQTDVNAQNFANLDIPTLYLREIIQTVKSNEQSNRGQDLQGGGLKTAVKHEQVLPDIHSLRQIVSTAKQNEQQLKARFGETNRQCHTTTAQVKQEFLESPCYAKRDFKPCAIRENRHLQSTEEHFIHETPNYQNDLHRIKSNEAISSNGYSYGSVRRKQSYSESHTSLGTNHHDSKAMIHKTWKTSSQENVTAVVNHSTFGNKSDKVNKKISASTSLIDPNRCSITHESTNYSDDHFKRNSAELRKKTFKVEKSSPTFENECSKRSIGKVSENISSFKSNSAKCSTGNDSKDISSSKSNTSASSKHSVEKDTKDVSSVKSNSTASSTTKCQNASTSHPIKNTVNKKRSFESRPAQDSPTPAKCKVQDKRKKAIRFKMLLPPDCDISEEYIKSFCREASKSPEAFRSFIRNGSCMLHSEIQKILAFNHVKSKCLNESEKNFIDCLEKLWIKLNHHLKFGTAAADGTPESDLLIAHSETQQDKTSKSFSGSQEDEPQKDKTSKSCPKSQDDGNLSFQEDSGKKRLRSAGPSESNTLPEKVENTKKLRMVISPGLRKAIRKSKGILTPDKMQRFLVQVYKRVHCVKIALYFSKDVPAICRQLDAVKKSYYRSGNRTTKDDLNMRIVHSLRKRMPKHTTCKNCMQD